MRSMAVVTSGRADYSLLRPLLLALQAQRCINLHLIVTGSHLISNQGDTWKDIEKDGLSISLKLSMFKAEQPKSSNNEKSVAYGLIEVVKGLADYFCQHEIDIVTVLGDRYEIFAVAQTALLFNIPIAHIHGGELSEGAIDDALRHSITKMSTLHFVATENYRRRVIQLGEQPSRVWNIGALALEGMQKQHHCSAQELKGIFGIDFSEPTALVTYHPETLSSLPIADQIEQVLQALRNIPTLNYLFTAPNIDSGGTQVMDAIRDFCADKSNRAIFIPSLGVQYYYSVLKQVVAMIGNSSSGIIEAPSFGLASINIGDRQRGRDRAESVIDVDCKAALIQQAIEGIIAKRSSKPILNPYINPKLEMSSSDFITDKLLNFDLSNKCRKQFYDLPIGRESLIDARAPE